MTARVITTGSDLLVQNVGSILTEIILRRESLCIENLDLIMRMLTHEINKDLQVSLNIMVRFSISNTNLAVDQLTKFRVMLTRASHRIRLMCEVPFLVGNMLPVERDIVSLSDTLRGPIDGIRQAWPEISFVFEFPENAKGFERIVDQHVLLILRNLLHNMASFSAEAGTIRISV